MSAAEFYVDDDHWSLCREDSGKFAVRRGYFGDKATWEGALISLEALILTDVKGDDSPQWGGLLAHELRRIADLVDAEIPNKRLHWQR